ncbi:MAG TPA: two-component regulator propeller domain-containing protein [Flavobacteriales bacterium]|nr:two-component regulator propeller domain-containing protein [Flavobacteriales bacterium]
MQRVCLYRFTQLFTTILGVILLFTSNAQNTRFRHLNVDDGLIQNSVNCITQDKQGFIWLATAGGLSRYDGTGFKTFSHRSDDPTSISGNHIMFVYADNENNLWIGTRWSGLNRMDLKTQKIERIKTDMKGNGFLNDPAMYCVVEGKDGKLYFGTLGGVNVYDKKTRRFSYIKNDPNDTTSVLDNAARSLAFDKRGNLWIGHIHGLSCYNLKTKKATRFSAFSRDPNKRLNNNNSIKSVFCDSKERIWISVWSGGMNIYDQRKGKMYSTDHLDAKGQVVKDIPVIKSRNDSSYSKRSDKLKFTCLRDLRMVFQVSEDSHGNIWFATVESSLNCFDPKTGQLRQFKNNPSDPGSICDNNVLSSYIDRSGLVWAGTLYAGLSIFNPYSDRFGIYKSDPSQPFSLVNSQVYAVHVGKYTRNTYVAVLGFVYKFDPVTNRFTDYVKSKKGETLLHPQSLVQALAEDAKGNLWISVNGSGVFAYDTLQKKLTNYNYFEGVPNSMINSSFFAVFEDKYKNMWFGADFGGIDKLLPDGGFKHNYPDSTGKTFLSSFVVRYITDDKDGNLWIATDSGVNVMNPVTEKIIYYRNKKNEKGSLPGNDVQSIYRDSRNTMWVGTTNGLCRFNASTKTFENLTAKYQVSPSGVYGITEDLNNNLWLLSGRGITRFNTVTSTWKEFDVLDGLQGNEFPLNTLATLSDGHIIMGGAKGLNFFQPELLVENRHIPQVSITNFLLRNNPLKTSTAPSFLKEVTLNYDHYFFTIEFASLDFTNLTKNKYRYKLEGLSNEWVDLGNKHQVTFVNLDPGEYLFRVAGSNNDGIWNEQGATVKIVITPPFWRTTWFYILCSVIILAGIYAFIKWRERKLNREKAVLEHKVNIRTVELREEKEKVEEANKEIRDSINYAQKIQHAIMPTEADFKKTIPQSFILFKPKDIVSGDFYWISHLPEGTVLYATADCTGHGVPGGFMSMLGTSFLNEIVNEQKITDPAKVLGILREKVINALKQTGSAGENKDGMDITLVNLDLKNSTMVFAGANNPLWIQRNGETNMTELKPDKQPIGYYVNQKEFTNHTVPLQKGDCIFSFTDGFADQFGGPKGKKFKYSSLEKVLLELDKNNFDRASAKMDTIIEEWKNWPGGGVYEQTDDVCVIGVKV